MKTLTTFIATAAFVIATGGAVLAQSQPHHQGNDAHMKMMMPAASDSASTKDFKEAHSKMMKDMHMPFTGNPDVDFVRGMIPHHQGAIDMAKIQLKHGKDAEVRKLAEQIIKDQEKEIAQMQAWLKKNAK
jgi:uncharacterized protein (DUF305 family)